MSAAGVSKLLWTILNQQQRLGMATIYITWIGIRCYLYPSYLFMFLRMADERIRETGIFFHKEMIFITVHTVLCALNIKWTYDLFTPIIKRWLGTGPKQMVVQNGL
jgi:hypothetical protein